MRTKDEQYIWTQDPLMGPRSKLKPDEVLKFLVELLEGCQSQEEIAYVAAGPLEDLITAFPNEILSSLDNAVRTHSKMRLAVTGVWIPKGTKPRAVLDQILNKYDLIYGNL